MSPLSSDPRAREAQLANLVPGAGAAGPGERRYAKHGGYAAIANDRLDAECRKVFAALAESAPVREDGEVPAADVAAVRLLATTLCRLDDVNEYVARRGWQDDEGRPRPVLDYEQRLRGHALDQMEALGMTPRSRAKLGLDLARAKRSLEDEIAAAPDWDDVVDGEAAA
jgi:hypothetical protein